MTYRQDFDRLGNPLPPPADDKHDWQHRTIQIGALIVIVWGVLMLIPVGR